MKWTEVRTQLQRKLRATKTKGKKHDMWAVEHNGVVVANVLDSHGKGEVTGKECGHIADSLGVSEGEVRKIVGCTMDDEEYFARFSS